MYEGTHGTDPMGLLGGQVGLEKHAKPKKSSYYAISKSLGSTGIKSFTNFVNFSKELTIHDIDFWSFFKKIHFLVK